MTHQTSFSTPIVRYYIDTRSMVPLNKMQDRTYKPEMPLINTLPQTIQDSVSRFMWVQDRYMSLSSALLKFYFIHRTAKVPWEHILISKTPKPHTRPFWNPPSEWHGNGFEGLEFNVSHQAGIVILAGCHTPSRPVALVHEDDDGPSITPDPEQQREQEIRIGVDVACTKELRRTPDVSTQTKLNEWVDTFAEVFSERDRTEMKEQPIPNASNPGSSQGVSSTTQTLNQKLRRFYTFWALKEAYIKMVGEGLLADWLKRLEFINVVAPNPGQTLTASAVGMKISFKDKDVSDSVKAELQGFEDNFLFTMISRGITEQGGHLDHWVALDIERDIRPCAEGTCSCLA